MSDPTPYASPPRLPQRSQYLTQLTIIAIVLMVAATVACCWSLIDAYGRYLMISGRIPIPTIMGNTPSMAQITAFFILDLLVIVLAPVIVFGAAQMLRRKMFGFARASMILAMLPLGTSCCCVLGLPMGIWAMIVLNHPDVKAAFGVHSE